MVPLRFFALPALLISLAAPIQAQSLIARADNLLRVGRMFAAETLYYYAVRRAPRDPEARLALGRYLAARGALRIGAVLMEEARYFGGDPKKVAVYLAPVYAQLGDFRALAALPATPLHYAERARAEWLRDNAPDAEGPDSLSVPYVPADTTNVLGTITLRIGSDSLVATIDPLAHGLTLDTAWMTRKETKTFASKFDSDIRNIAGVTRAMRIGGLTMMNVVTRYAPMPRPWAAVIGLDLLTTWAPTFDAPNGRIMLRATGRIDRDPLSERLSTLTYGSGLWIVHTGGMVPLAGSEAGRLLRGRAWTVDARRGEIVLSRTTSEADPP